MRIVISYMAMFFIGVLVGILLFAKFHEDKVVVKEVKVKETVYVKKPVTLKGYKECYESKINIQATAMDERTIKVRAFDKCKEAEADVEIDVSDNSYKKIFVATAAGIVISALVFIILF